MFKMSQPATFSQNVANNYIMDKANYKTWFSYKYFIMLIGYSNMNGAHQCTCGWMDWGHKVTIRWEVRGKDIK